MKKRGNMSKMMARDIRKNWLQYISMIAITMLAVTLFCGFVSNTLTLEKTVDDYYADSNLTDLIAQFSSDAYGRSSIGDSGRQYFTELSGNIKVEKIEYRFYAEGSVNQKSAKIYAGNNYISTPIITEGEPGVLVDHGEIMSDDFKIGQEIEIELPGYPAMRLKITGFMRFAEVSDTHTFCPLYLSADVLAGAIREKTGLPVYSLEPFYNQVLIKTPEPDTVKDYIESHFGSGGGLIYIYDHSTMESVAALKGEVTTSLRMIYVFPVIFLLVSILVIMTTLSALILRERTNIGTLKGIGVTNGRVLAHYSFFGAILCLIGGLIGAVIGPFIVPNIMLIKYTLVYSMPAAAGIVFSFKWSAIAVLGVSALAAVIGMLACRSVIKEKPAECMRPQPPRENVLLNLTAGASERKKSGSLPLKMARRNIIIKPSRAVMTIVGVMGCVALLVCSFGIGDTVNNSVDLELGGQFKYDISATYTQDAAADFLEKMDGFIADGTIKNYETYKTYYMTARSGGAVKNIKVFQIKDGSAFTTISPGGGVLISKSVADDLGIKNSGALILTTGGSEYQLTINGVIETALTKGVFVTEDFFAGSYHSLGMWIQADETEELIEAIKESNGTQVAVSMKEQRENVMRAVSSIDAIKYTMMIFSIALAVVVLYNLSLLNIKERNRSIATLKVLGFSNLEVSSSLFYEIIILVLIGTGLGLILGFPVLYLVMSINKIELVAFIYGIKPVSYVFAAAISLATATVINLIFGKRLKKIHMIDSLKSVE